MKLYIDEAGRGPLAGPMHIGIVLPLKKFDKSIFKDSKKLSENKREELYHEIEKLQESGKIKCAIGSVTNTEIDKLGVTKALNLAIKRGISSIIGLYKKNGITKKDIQARQKENNEKLKLIIDGNRTFGLEKDLEIQVETIVKGDDKVKEISIASIIAKVSRDEIMTKIMDKKYPKYNFKKHKGYGTKDHITAIKQYGPCKIHRKLFLKKLFS